MATDCIEIMEPIKLGAPIPEICWLDLHKSHDVLFSPFQLRVTNSEEILFCDEIVRFLPGKRLVTFGTWCDKPVVIKLFYEKGQAQRHVQREVAGLQKLIASHTPTPTLLWQGSAQKQKIQILLFERIIGALNLDLILHEQYTSDELSSVMEEITIELATQHVLGIVQKDLHLKNFLVTEKKIYTLDGGSIVQNEGILSKEKSLDHLALFFAQLGMGSEHLQEKLFQIYVNARSWIVKKADTDFLRHATHKWIQKRWTRYEKKIQRSSTAFTRIKTPKALIMYDKAYLSSEFATFLTDPEEIFNQYGTHIIKNGRSATVVKIQINNRDYIMKRYNIKNKWHALRRAFRMSRAASSWILGQRLRLMNIPTARPVAFIENRFLGLRSKSYFIMEFIDGPHAGEYFSKTQDERLVTKTAQRIVTLFHHLAKLHLTHGDLKMTNILIQNDRPVIIDLDGMTEHRNRLSLKLALKKEMRRFMKNWEDQPSLTNLFKNLISGLIKI